MLCVSCSHSQLESVQHMQRLSDTLEFGAANVHTIAGDREPAEGYAGYSAADPVEYPALTVSRASAQDDGAADAAPGNRPRQPRVLAGQQLLQQPQPLTVMSQRRTAWAAVTRRTSSRSLSKMHSRHGRCVHAASTQLVLGNSNWVGEGASVFRCRDCNDHM